VVALCSAVLAYAHGNQVVQEEHMENRSTVVMGLRETSMSFAIKGKIKERRFRTDETKINKLRG
jgi:hypothetical protein